jgi:hypothetical protein
LQLLSPLLSHCALYWGSHPDQFHHHICSDHVSTVFCMSSLTWYFQLLCLLTAYLFVVFMFDALEVILLHLRIHLFWAVNTVALGWCFLTFQSHTLPSPSTFIIVIWPSEGIAEGRGVGVKWPSHVAESKQQHSGWQNAHFRWTNFVLCTQPNLDYWAKQNTTQ